MKRLRLRGDWSDTGPRARPESERERDGKITVLQLTCMGSCSFGLKQKSQITDLAPEAIPPNS